MSKAKVDSPERGPSMNQDEGDGTEMAPILAVDLTAIVRHLKKFWELDLDWSDGAFLQKRITIVLIEMAVWDVDEWNDSRSGILAELSCRSFAVFISWCIGAW